MTLEMQEMLEREMEDALAIDDATRRQDAMLVVLAHHTRALVDCQRKTSDRVKVIYTDIPQIKTDLARCVESDREYRKAKSDAKAIGGFLGFCGKWVWPVVKKGIELIGAPTAAIIFCKMTGILW